MTVEINEKLQGIMQSRQLDDLPLKYLPPVSDNPDNYYFVSYSHKDYKQVYPDIFALQGQGVNIWYDRAMPAGRSWKETAEKYISPSRCAGVVFYVSENSLMSPAIHEEIAYAKRCGKSCLTINLPMSDGKSRAVSEMLDVMRAGGADIPVDKYDFLSRSFNEEILYLPYSQSAEQKAEKVLSLKKPSVFEYSFNAKRNEVTLVAVKDIELRKVEESDLLYVDEQTGETREVNIIGRCAFANCLSLQQVALPPSVSSIEEYAFCNCVSLKQINLNNIEFLKTFAFLGCVSLRDVGFAENSKLEFIVKGTFNGCKSLQKIDIPRSVKQIAMGSFYDTGLREIIIPDNVKTIEDWACFQCPNLERIVIGDYVSEIGDNAFWKCTSVKEIHIGASLKTIGDGAFYGCGTKLQQITVSPENKYFYAMGNCLIEKISHKVVFAGTCSVIPSRLVDVIGDSAFAGCESLQKLEIPDTVSIIEDFAFSRCVNLREIHIGSGLSSIGNKAFDECNSLKAVHIHDLAAWCKIQFLDYANPLFYAHNLYFNNKLVENLTLSEEVELVTSRAFCYCTSLKTLYLEGARHVEQLAFEGCSNLTAVYISDNVELIDDGVFVDCDKLRYNKYEGAKYLGSDKNPYQVCVEVLDDNTGSVKIHPDTKYIAGGAFLNCKNLTELDVPYGLKSIGARAFMWCEKLCIDFPQSIQYFGDSAFRCCYNQQVINLGEGVKFLGDSVFQQSVAHINYFGTSTQWNDIKKAGKWYDNNNRLRSIRCNDGTLRRA